MKPKYSSLVLFVAAVLLVDPSAHADPPRPNPHYDRPRSTLTTRDKPEHLLVKTHRQNQKPRVIITTDINAGSGDPDDRQSLCHVLWYANDLDIRAIIPDRFKPTAIEACNIAFDLYDRDFRAPKNRLRTLGYPSANALRKQALVTERSAAIKRIIDEAQRDDERPLWVLVWGNMKLIGEALKAEPKIADKLRLITIATNVKAKESGGDGTKINWNGGGRQYVFDNFPKMWWLESDWTYNGMFHGPEAIQLKEDLAACGGNVGQHISDVIDTVPWADNFRAGDTPTVLYMIDPGHDLNNPSETSWAGRYVQPFPKARPNYWTGIDGGYDWDYANTRETWSNASAVYQVRAKTLADQRSAMYAALLRRVQTIYGTTSYKRPDRRGNLPAFAPPKPLIIEAETSKHSGLPTGRDKNASGGRYLNLNDSGWIVWRFYFDGEPAEHAASIRFRLPTGNKQQTLFVNGAKIGSVEFSGEPLTWQSHMFSAHLEKGPNSIVLRKADGGIHIDSLEIEIKDKQAAGKPKRKQVLLGGKSYLLNGRHAFLMEPAGNSEAVTSDAGGEKPWIFYGATLFQYPDQAESWMHQKFLDAGIAVAGIDVGEAYGSPHAFPHFEALYQKMVKDGYSKKPALLGRSRGGLWVSSWAIEHPDRVAGIGGIYPCYDYTTYPGLKRAAPAYGVSEQVLAAQQHKLNPIKRAGVLADAKIPVFIIHGRDDKVVPLAENSAALEDVYKSKDVGGLIEVIKVDGQGHSFWPGYFQCQELVDFLIDKARSQ